MTDFQKTLGYVYPDTGFIAKPALSEATGQATQKIWSYLTQWHANSIAFQYTGPPDPEINGAIYWADVDGDPIHRQGYIFKSEFYVIFKTANKKDDGTRKLGMTFIGWNTREVCPINDETLQDPYMKWTPDYLLPLAFEEIINQPASNENDNATYGDEAGPSYTFHEARPGTFRYNPNNGGYRCGILTVEQIMVANLMIWETPSLKFSDDNAECTPSDVSRGEIIRGYNTTDMASFGGLIHMMGTGEDDQHSSIENTTRRTLFQWGHPVCIYIAPGTTAQNIFGHFTIPVKVRNLTETTLTSQVTHPAMVIKGGGPNSSITFTSTFAGANNTATYNLPAAIGNWQLIEHLNFGNNLNVKRSDMDYITITATTGAGEELQIKTVALFEGAGY